MRMWKVPHLDKWRDHGFPISPLVWRLMELQVKVKFTNSALWYHLVAVHQGLWVSPERKSQWMHIVFLTHGRRWMNLKCLLFTCSNATAHCSWSPGRSFDPGMSFLFQVQTHVQPRKRKVPASDFPWHTGCTILKVQTNDNKSCFITSLQLWAKLIAILWRGKSFQMEDGWHGHSRGLYCAARGFSWKDWASCSTFFIRSPHLLILNWLTTLYYNHRGNMFHYKQGQRSATMQHLPRTVRSLVIC